MAAWSAGCSHAIVMLLSSKASVGTRTAVGGAGAAGPPPVLGTGALAAALEPPAAARASEHSAVVAIVLHRMSLSPPRRVGRSVPVLDDVLPDEVPVDVQPEAGGA